MPRVFNSGANVDEWCRVTGEGSSTFDICRVCAQRLQINPHHFDNVLTPYGQDEPEGDAGREGETDHPCYSEENYSCETCGRELSSLDN